MLHKNSQKDLQKLACTVMTIFVNFSSEHSKNVIPQHLNPVVYGMAGTFSLKNFAKL
jgi:hypothetical protein